MPDLYDMILYGLRGEGEEREIAKHTIARLLKLKPEAIEAGLAQPEGMLIQSGVTEQMVRKYQSALSTIGGLSRFQPAAPRATSAEVQSAGRSAATSASGEMAGGLSLEPLDRETAAHAAAEVEPEASWFSGLNLSLDTIEQAGAEPAPADQPTGAAAGPAAPAAPSFTPQAFGKGTGETVRPTPDTAGKPQQEAVIQPPEEDKTALKIKRRLAELQQIRELHALQEGIHPAQQLHRRHTDLPQDRDGGDRRSSSLLSSLPLAATAGVGAGGLVAGLAIGAVLFALLRSPAPPVPPVAFPAPAPGAAPHHVEPALAALLQLSAFAEPLPPQPAGAVPQPAPATPPATGSGPAGVASGGSDTGGVTVTGNAPAVGKPVVDPAVALEQLRHDRTWSRHLYHLHTRLLAEDQADKAYQMALAISESDAKWLALLSVADYQQRRGNSAGRDQILGQYQAAVDALDDKPSRIGALRLLAGRLADLGEPQRAADAVKRAEALLPQLATRAAKIAGRGQLAAMYLDLGEPAKADGIWQETNRIIAEETYPQTRLAYYIDLANGYTLAGRRDSAIALLAEVNRLTNRLPPADRPLVLRSLAIGFARARDPESALAAAAAMQPTDDLQATLLDLVRELISQGLPYDAISIAEQLDQPVYRTRAEAAVAWSLKVDAKQDIFASNLFTHAGDLLSSIGHPADQAVAMGDVGRYQHWAEQVDAIPTLSNAAAAAQRISEPHARDLALALVAREYVRSAQWQPARDLQAMIGDPPVSAAVAEDIDRVMKLLEPQVPEPLPASLPPELQESEPPPELQESEPPPELQESEPPPEELQESEPPAEPEESEPPAQPQESEEPVQ